MLMQMHSMKCSFCYTARTQSVNMKFTMRTFLSDSRQRQAFTRARRVITRNVRIISHLKPTVKIRVKKLRFIQRAISIRKPLIIVQSDENDGKINDALPELMLF